MLEYPGINVNGEKISHLHFEYDKVIITGNIKEATEVLNDLSSIHRGCIEHQYRHIKMYDKSSCQLKSLTYTIKYTLNRYTLENV